jgi:ribosomal protein S18 acetylase RimI-like enzyme
MPNLLLREATLEEAPAVVAVVRGAFEEYRDRLHPPSRALNATVEQVRQKMAHAGVVVASLDDAIVGCAYYERQQDRLYLGQLAVLPACRRLGIGRSLIAYVEARAREFRLPRVRLGVRLALAPLRAYYERMGYRVSSYGTHEGYSEPTYAILEKDLVQDQATHCPSRARSEAE